MTDLEDQLPAGWAQVHLHDISQPGGTCNPAAGDGDDFLYVDIEALDNAIHEVVTPKRLQRRQAPSRARMAIRAGDVLFSLVRPYLENIAVVPEWLDRQVASTAYAVLRPEAGVVSRYVFYALTRHLFINSVVTYGNSPPAARDDEFFAMTVPLAPSHEQRRIVAAIEEHFTRLGTGVANLRRVQAALKRYRAAVLKAAVEGKLTEAWRAEHPDVEPASSLLSRILSERRERWEADLRAKGKDPGKAKYEEPSAVDLSDLPMEGIPEGWCWATLEQLSDPTRLITYGVIKLGDPVPGGVPVLRSSNVRHLRLALDGLKSISPVIARNYARTFLQGGEVLVTVRGTLGGVVVAPSSCSGFNISREVAMVALIRPTTGLCLAYFIGSGPIQTWLLRNAKGITYTGINIETLKHTPIPLPSEEEMAAIVAEVERRLSVVGELEATVDANLRRADRLRQAILQQAFAGRLVPQDPNDEPASVLLDRIRRGRAGQARANGRGRQSTRRVVISEVDTPADGNDSGRQQLVGTHAQQAQLWDGDK